MDDITKTLEVKTDLWELMLAGVIKYYTEKLLAKTFVGNGTLKSGLIKLGLPVIAEMFLKNSSIKNNILYKSTKTALVIDGTEDVVKYLMENFAPSMFGGNTANNNNTIQTI